MNRFQTSLALVSSSTLQMPLQRGAQPHRAHQDPQAGAHAAAGIFLISLFFSLTLSRLSPFGYPEPSEGIPLNDSKVLKFS